MESASPMQVAVAASEHALSAAEEAKFSEVVVSQLTKTKICGMFLRGSCLDTTCRFAHSRSELRALPDLTKTAICRSFTLGKCYDTKCKFAHGEQELRCNASVYKTQLCNFFARGHCKKGDRCRHAHGTHELRGAEVVPLLPPTKEPAAVRTPMPVGPVPPGHGAVAPNVPVAPSKRSSRRGARRVHGGSEEPGRKGMEASADRLSGLVGALLGAMNERTVRQDEPMKVPLPNPLAGARLGSGEKFQARRPSAGACAGFGQDQTTMLASPPHWTELLATALAGTHIAGSAAVGAPERVYRDSAFGGSLGYSDESTQAGSFSGGAGGSSRGSTPRSAEAMDKEEFQQWKVSPGKRTHSF